MTFSLKKPLMIEIREQDLLRIRGHLEAIQAIIRRTLVQPHVSMQPEINSLRSQLIWVKEYLERVCNMIGVIDPT